MYWSRMTQILPAISLFLMSGPSVFGQNRSPLPDAPSASQQNQPYGPDDPWNNQTGGPYVPWAPADVSGRNADSGSDVGRTTMERQMDQMEHNDPFGMIPTPDAQANSIAPAGSDAVSVHQLQHPLSHRWLALLAQFQSDLEKGHVKSANKVMAKALKEPAAAPYVHAILGTHYLKKGWPFAAVPELEKAAQALPMPSLHSNLGYALCLTGQTKRGEVELQKALSLDGDAPQTRFLMGVILLNQKSREREAQYDLRMAQSKVPTAHLALAICHMRQGEMQAAENQISEFLGPNRKNDLLRMWNWASEVASQPQPATAFGFPYLISGSPPQSSVAAQH